MPSSAGTHRRARASASTAPTSRSSSPSFRPARIFLICPTSRGSNGRCISPPRLRRLPRSTARACEPSLSHLTSPWPVEKIWRAHQAEGKDLDVDMTGGSVWLEVRATGDEVTVRSIESGTYALRDALGRGMSLGEAVEIALGSHPTLDVEAEIRSTLEDNIFSHFTVLAREET